MNRLVDRKRSNWRDQAVFFLDPSMMRATPNRRRIKLRAKWRRDPARTMASFCESWDRVERMFLIGVNCESTASAMRWLEPTIPSE